MSAPVCSPRVSSGISPAPGATSQAPAWWSDADWTAEVTAAVQEAQDVCKSHHIAPDTVVAVAQGMAYFADHRTGRDCRPGNERLMELVRVSLSTVKRARRVLRELDLVVELIRGRSFMTREERLEAWRRGSSHRKIASVFALCSRRRRAPKVGSSQVRYPYKIQSAPASLVERDPLPGALEVVGVSHLRTTHLRRQTDDQESRSAARSYRSERTKGRGGPDPATRRLAEGVQRRLRWLAGLSPRRITPTLSRFARAGWTARDVDRAVADALAARGWRLPRELRQPAAYLAGLLREVDPMDRPGALDEHMAAVEAAQRAYERQLIHGAPCPHGQPAGDVPSPLRGHLACPACRRAAS